MGVRGDSGAGNGVCQCWVGECDAQSSRRVTAPNGDAAAVAQEGRQRGDDVRVPRHLVLCVTSSAKPTDVVPHTCASPGRSSGWQKEEVILCESPLALQALALTLSQDELDSRA